MSQSLITTLFVSQGDPKVIDRLINSSLCDWLATQLLRNPSDLLNLARSINSNDPNGERLRLVLSEFELEIRQRLDDDPDLEEEGCLVGSGERHGCNSVAYEVISPYPPTLQMIDLLTELQHLSRSIFASKPRRKCKSYDRLAESREKCQHVEC